MKLLNKIMFGSALLLGALTFTGCSDDDSYDVDGISYQRVYFDKSTNVATGSVIKTPVGTITSVAADFNVKTTKAPEQDVHVSVAVDNSYVDTYNKANGTHYEALPEGTVTLSTNTLTIPADTTASRDTLHITLSDDKAGAVTSTNGYIIPVVIKSCDGNGYQPSRDLSVRYLTISYLEKSINDDATELLGTALSDDVLKTFNCIAASNLDPDGYSDLFGGGWYGSSWSYQDNNNPEASFTLDMQETRKVTGVSVGSNSMLANLKIEVSSDNQTWAELGTTSKLVTIGSSWRDRKNWAVFFGAIPCRYIRLTQTMSTQSSWWYYYAEVSGIGIAVAE